MQPPRQPGGASSERTVFSTRSATRGEWVKATGLYAEAIAADTTFWLAHLRYRIANGWSFGSGPPSEFVRPLAEIRDSLPPREQLQVDARLAPNGPERYAIAERLISSYPNYVPGLLDQADRLNHFGPYYGRENAPRREHFSSIPDRFNRHCHCHCHCHRRRRS